MTLAAAESKPRISRIVGAVMVLALVLVAFAAPSAQAKTPKRVVAITPFAAQVMLQLHVKPKAIGMTLGETPRQKKMFAGQKRMVLSHPNGPNLEELARLKPDLVFSSTRWRAGTAAMKRLGIRVVYVDPVRVDQVKPAVTKIGKILGRQKQAAARNRVISKGIAKSMKGISTHPKVLVVLGVGRTPMAFLGNSWGGQIVKKAGGYLVTGGASASGGFARISDEVVVAMDPDVIILVPHGNTGDLDQITDYVLNNEAWKSTTALQQKQLYSSGDNILLQSGTDIGSTISWVRRTIGS